MNKLSCTISPDNQTLSVTFADAPGTTMSLGATQVEELIRVLAQARTRMQPGVPEIWEPGGSASGTLNPPYTCEREALRNDALVHIRHPGLGWLHFDFPPEEARALGHHLIILADTGDAATAIEHEKPN